MALGRIFGATLATAALMSGAESRLIVLGPSELQDQFPQEEKIIKANYGNFGYIPYGQSIIGNVYYDLDNPDGCEPFSLRQHNRQSEDFVDRLTTPIVIVERGYCSFVDKVRNVEAAGGSLAVIIDDKNEDIDNVILSDDGTGMGIRIPSMIIGRSDGETIMNYVKDNKDATLSAEFVVDNPLNIVELEFWFSSYNSQALDFIKQFDEYVHELEDDLYFTPRFVTWACPDCPKTFKDSECFSDGKYCAPNHMLDAEGRVKGHDIITEDLRESCLHERLYSNSEEAKWWDYMKFVHKECFGFITEKCSKLAHRDIGEDFEKTQACVQRSFKGKDWTIADNDIMSENAENWKEYGTLYWPSIVINKRTFRGDVNAENVMEAVCAAYNDPPQACIDFFKVEEIVYVNNREVGAAVPDDSISTELLIFIITFLVGVNLLLILAYRRCMKREMQEDMSIQVSSAVSQYIKLSQQKNQNTQL